MTISINCDYTFTSNHDDADGEILDINFLDGHVSQLIYDKYEFWADLDDKIVSVVSVIAARKTGGCGELAKVFIKDKGVKWWFTAKADELVPVTNSNPTCKCELSIIMIRGCQCGGA
jgi:hypothetical protein